jgi:hypothetical protein
VELMIGITVLTMIASAIGTLAMLIQDTNTLNRGNTAALQHARVVFDRLDRTLQGCQFNFQFPGCIVVNWTVGTNSYPDTLVVWSPQGAPADPTGLPRRHELIVYTPGKDNPSILEEVTDRTGPTTTVPASSDQAGWRTMVTNMINSPTAKRIPLTSLLRTGVPLGGTGQSHGMVRFRTALAPTETDLAYYNANNMAWGNMSWPLNTYGQEYGVAQRVCFVELQLVPQGEVSSSGNAIPFFWSVSVQRTVKR